MMKQGEDMKQGDWNMTRGRLRGCGASGQSWRYNARDTYGHGYSHDTHTPSSLDKLSSLFFFFSPFKFTHYLYAH